MSEPYPAAVVPRRRIGGIGMAASILVGAVAILDVVSTWTTWHAYGLVRDYAGGTGGVSGHELVDADDLITTVSWLVVGAYVAAAVVFLVWLWQARANAELLCDAPHRRARGWVIGSWICPIVNLWFPFMIVDDVYRASRPQNPPDLFDLRTVPGSPLVGWWWALFLGDLVLDRIEAGIWTSAYDAEGLRSAGIAEVIGSALILGAAVTLILIVRQISTWQDNRAA